MVLRSGFKRSRYNGGKLRQGRYNKHTQSKDTEKIRTVQQQVMFFKWLPQYRAAPNLHLTVPNPVRLGKLGAQHARRLATGVLQREMPSIRSHQTTSNRGILNRKNY